MSKSVGNVVRPDDLVEAFGVDALRWHFVAEMSFGQDASFSDEDFLSGYNADLANGLGNTLSRAVRMSRDFFEGKTPPKKSKTKDSFEGPSAAAAARKATEDWKSSFEGYRLQDAAAAIRALLGAIDAEITASEPWKAVRQPAFSPGALRLPFGRPLRLPRGAARRGLHARADRAADGDGDLSGGSASTSAPRTSANRPRLGGAPARGAASAGAAAVSEGGREGILCFQGEERG